jgi:hypothetical protein
VSEKHPITDPPPAAKTKGNTLSVTFAPAMATQIREAAEKVGVSPSTVVATIFEDATRDTILIGGYYAAVENIARSKRQRLSEPDMRGA